jgi:predicted metal-dependent hydrolase
MTETIELGDLVAYVTQKKIKNVYLSVHPPTGNVRISAPHHMSLDTIRAFAISKLGWIKQVRSKLRDQVRETPREYLDRESRDVWGKCYLLRVIEREAPPRVELENGTLTLHIRPGADRAKKEAIVAQWYRDQIKDALPPLIDKWTPVIGVTVANIFIQQMKTRWGSCNPAAQNIRLNSELAKKPREFLEYVLVHELVHLLEPTHNHQFKALMDRFLPQWRSRRDSLNLLPVRHEDWAYRDGLVHSHATSKYFQSR